MLPLLIPFFSAPCRFSCYCPSILWPPSGTLASTFPCPSRVFGSRFLCPCLGPCSFSLPFHDEAVACFLSLTFSWRHSSCLEPLDSLAVFGTTSAAALLSAVSSPFFGFLHLCPLLRPSLHLLSGFWALLASSYLFLWASLYILVSLPSLPFCYCFQTRVCLNAYFRTRSLSPVLHAHPMTPDAFPPSSSSIPFWAYFFASVHPTLSASLSTARCATLTLTGLSAAHSAPFLFFPDGDLLPFCEACCSFRDYAPALCL